MGISPVNQHGIAKSLALHLVPGLLAGGCYYALAPVVGRWGYPSIMALMLAVGVALLPFELGWLIAAGRREGHPSLLQVVSYRTSLSIWRYLLWVPVLFVLLGVVFALMKPVDGFLREHLFSRLPVLEAGLGEGYTRNALIVTYVMVAAFGVILGPVVEELYFRGYLLPRMGYAGRWAPLLHSFLFALYHIWTPWMVVTRTVGMLPLVYAAQRRSLYLSIAVHVLVNAIDLIAGISFVVAMAGPA